MLLATLVWASPFEDDILPMQRGQSYEVNGITVVGPDNVKMISYEYNEGVFSATFSVMVPDPCTEVRAAGEFSEEGYVEVKMYLIRGEEMCAQVVTERTVEVKVPSLATPSYVKVEVEREYREYWGYEENLEEMRIKERYREMEKEMKEYREEERWRYGMPEIEIPKELNDVCEKYRWLREKLEGTQASERAKEVLEKLYEECKEMNVAGAVKELVERSREMRREGNVEALQEEIRRLREEIRRLQREVERLRLRVRELGAKLAIMNGKIVDPETGEVVYEGEAEIEVDDEVKVEIEQEGILIVDTEDNVYAKVEGNIVVDTNGIMVGQAYLRIPPGEIIKEIVRVERPKEIKVEVKAGKPVYVVRGEEEGRLLFFIPVKYEVEYEVDGEEGKIVGTRAPWWSFLVSK